MFNLFKNIWEYLFFPWAVEIIEEGHETWYPYNFGVKMRGSGYNRNFIKYKYTHRFRPQVKIVKKYLN